MPGLYAPQPYTPVKSSALEAGKVLSTINGVHLMTNIGIDSTAATGVYYVHLIQGTDSVPGNGAYAAGITFLHPPIAWAHVNGVPDNILIDDLPGGAAFTGGLVIVLSTTQFTKTGSAYALFDSAIQ
jgi:hypothetical protein